MQNRAVILALIASYYDGDLEDGENALEMLGKAELKAGEAEEYEFNRLFVGPGHLLAPPYASTYLSPEKAVMQAETLKVRKFYEEFGMELVNKNRIPDDFLGYELMFLALLEEIIQQEEDNAEFIELRNRFIKEHLANWLPEHLAKVRANAKTKFCLALNDALAEVFQTYL